MIRNLFSAFESYRGLPRAVYFLFIVRIISAMGNFVYPFLTLFLTAKIGLTPKEAGTFFMIVSVTQAIGMFAGGKLCDHMGRKKLLIFFMATVGILMGSCVISGNTIMTAYIIVFSGFFMGAQFAVSTAVITDITNPENRKNSFALLYLGVNIGFMIGPTLAGLLYRSHSNFIFLGNAVSSLIAIIIIWKFIPDTTPTVEDMMSANLSKEEAHEEGTFIDAMLKRPILMLFLLGRLAFTFCYASISFIIPLQMVKLFGDNQGPALYGVLMSVTGFVVITFTLPAIKLTGKMKPLTSIGLAGILYAIGYGLLGRVSLFSLILLAGFIFTLGEVIEATNSGVYVANRSPINQRGRFNAVSQITSNLGFAIAPGVYGFLIEYQGLSFTWNVCMWLSIGAAFYMLGLSYFEDSINKKNKFDKIKFDTI